MTTRIFGYSHTVRSPTRKANAGLDDDEYKFHEDGTHIDLGPNAGDGPPQHPLDIATDPGDAPDDTSPRGGAALHLDGLADLLVKASNGQLSKPNALHWRMFTQPGRALAHRLAALNKRAEQKKDQDMATKTYNPNLNSAIVKRFGIQRFCKSVENGNVRVSEHELTALIKEQAEREKTTFEKLYAIPGVWKAVEVAKQRQFVEAGRRQMPIMPTVTVVPIGETDNPTSALDQLYAMAEKMRQASPGMTPAQAFEQTYMDPKNAALVAAERAAARAALPTVGGRFAG
jgi:hypothetical protein